MMEEDMQHEHPPKAGAKKGGKLARINQQIAHLEKQKKELVKREKARTQKARTRRLLEIGAITLNYLDCPAEIEPKDFELVIQQVVAVLGSRQAKKQSNT